MFYGLIVVAFNCQNSSNFTPKMGALYSVNYAPVGFVEIVLNL